MSSRLVLVLGDQLSDSLPALRDADSSRDHVLMAEVADEATYVKHHPKKIALFFAAMRKFARRLLEQGWRVRYVPLEDPDNSGSIPGEIRRAFADLAVDGLVMTRCGDWRLQQAIEALPIESKVCEDDRFVCTPQEFRRWAKGRKQLRMEWFYREMRRKTGLLMDGSQPVGGRWNFDTDNRKPPTRGLSVPALPTFEPDETVRAVLKLVSRRFAGHFGVLESFALPTDREQALELLQHFIRNALPSFGDFQDAMVSGEPVLYHSMLVPALNLGLLEPMEVCRAAEAEWQAGRAPLNAVEGFIRQIIGWREFIRGVWALSGPEYLHRNVLQHRRALPDFYWNAKTQMNCVAQVVNQTRQHAYAHHIQRLMITGNFALLAGIDPAQVHEWYLSVYADAVEWVEAPNTLGMSQFADGGVVASKPYVSSGAYIHRMSDYCEHCAYRVQDKSGPDACPFNLLYWHFIDRHRRRFLDNPRMAMIYKSWDSRPDQVRARILADAEDFLARMDRDAEV